LFGATLDAPTPSAEPPFPAPALDPASLEAALFGRGEPEIPQSRLPPGDSAGGRRRIVAALAVVLVVVAIGAAAYAIFGR
jgi:hypothetical protein